MTPTMTKINPIITSLATWTYVCCIAASSLHCQAYQGASSNSSDTCTSDELNHSILVECNAASCGGSSTEEIIWPDKPDEIIHIQSVRAGERFAQTRLPNLNVTEDHTTKLLNINTTLNVILPKDFYSQEGQQLIGFGATLNANELATALQDGLFDRLFCLVLDDLFGQSSSSAQLNLLRLHVGKDFYLTGHHNLSRVLLALESQPKKHTASSRIKIKLVIEFEDQSSFVRELDELASVRSSLANIELWGVAIQTKGPLDINTKNLLPGVRLLASTTLTDGRHMLNRTPSGQPIPGTKHNDLLIQAQPSVPYEALDDLVSEMANKFETQVLTLGQPQSRSKDYGDWENANQVAIQILNHLRHGSLGYIEDKSIAEVLALPSSSPTEQQDASLYSLHHSHGLHFRGPRFYAIGHFSRYLKPGSNKLNVNLFTQPNMFAAHYAAFISPNRKHIVGIVLNDNEHLLPFRMAINDVVMAFTGLQPKSFNTFLIKLEG